MTEQTATPPIDPRRRIFATLRRWWRHLIVEDVDQEQVIAKLREESALNPRYLFMTCMSAGIAILGLLLSSPAVVIGAMLLSPLMGPLLGAGFALAIGDFAWVRRCSRTVGIGVICAVVFSALIVLASPLQTVTTEIAARTKPNLFDLLVALFSALAGSYAMIRGREGTIVGVAIATALMPPIAVVGFGLATFNMTVFGGSLMLFVTNLLTIALSAAVTARYYGFRSTLSERHTMMQTVGIAAAFVLLAIPLGIALSQIAWETNASRQINGVVAREFGDKARVSAIEIDYDAEPVRVTATVLTPEFRPLAQANAERKLRATLRRAVAVELDQFQVGADPGAAEAAQLARARAAEQAAAVERRIAALVQQLSVVAGVEPDEVTVDREHRRALVDARPIEGTTLAGYRALERRVAQTMPDWSVRLRPPLRPLPDIGFADGEPSREGLEAIGLVGWAASRTRTPIGLAGDSDEVAAVVELLKDQGVTVEARDGGAAGIVRTRWLAGDE